MFIEHLQQLYQSRRNHGEAIDSINLCSDCLDIVSKELKTREYTSKGRPSNIFLVDKLFGKPLVKEIEVRTNNGYVKAFEKCLKHGYVLLNEEEKLAEDTKEEDA